MQLLNWLENSGQSQRQLALAAKSSAISISRILRGLQRPSPELAKRIEAATNGEVTAAELLGLDTPPARMVSESRAPYHPAPARAQQKTVTLPLAARDAEDARELGVDIETIAREAAIAAVKTAIAAEFKRQSAAGIAASNAWVAEYGTLTEQLGAFRDEIGEDDNGAV